MSDLPLVLVTEGADPTPLAWLRARARVIEAAPGSPAYNAALPDAAGMVVRTYTRVNADLLARCPLLVPELEGDHKSRAGVIEEGVNRVPYRRG